MTSALLAWTSLRHQGLRTIISVVGTTFAVVLVFMQLGFLGSVERTATLFYSKLNCDIVLLSEEYIDLSRPGQLPRTRLAQARAVPGVQHSLAITLGMAAWKNPTDDPVKGGLHWNLTAVAIDPAELDLIFRPPGQGGIFPDAATQAEARVALARLNEVFLDERSRPDFGEPSQMPPGTQTELNGRQVTLAGYFSAGTGFSYTGLLLMNDRNFQDYIYPMQDASMGIIQVQPGASVREVKEALEAIYPNGSGIRVVTRLELEEEETDYWVNRTAVGQLFYFGVILAITVGAIFIYQMMVADIKKNLPEYATLKAMGYRFAFMFRTVLWQSVYLALGGFTLGLVVALVLYEVTRQAARLPIDMTIERIGTVLVLTIGMCVGSGLLAVRKIRTADPADLF